MANDDRTVVNLRPRIQPGTRLNGIYEIESLIGVGGMGEVYKGRAIQTNDAVAIKTIRPDMATNEAALALFRREAQALHNLYNEAIVRYYVFSVDPVVGSPYLAMEFVDGQPLAAVLKRGPLDFDAVDTLRRRIAGGLAAAHDVGIVHRDMSPDNIILPGGRVERAKIIDFGIAKATILGEGTIIGTGFAGRFNYASPEQLGLFGGEVGPASDIYSLGLVLAEASTGTAIDMGGTQIQVIEKRRTVPDLSHIDARLRPLIAHMLQPQPGDRPASMGEVAAWRAAGSPLAGSSSKAKAVKVEGVAKGEAKARKALPLGLIGAGIATLTVAGGLFVAPIPWADLMRGRSANTPPVPQLVPTPDPNTPPNGTASSSSASNVPLLQEAPVERPPLVPSSPPVQQPTSGPGPIAPIVSPVAPTPNPPVTPAVVPPSTPVVAPQPTVTEPPSRMRQIADFIQAYDGGPCFALQPMRVTDTSARIEGFGERPDPFVAFDKTFKQTYGFEAQISLRLLTSEQCAVPTLVGSPISRRGTAPSLDLSSFDLKSGQNLSGTVTDFGGRHVTLLMVSDDGFVHDLASLSRRQGTTISFNMRVEATGGPRAKPQVILALTSARPFASITPGRAVSADALIPRLLEEAAGQSMGLAIKYFVLAGT
jgi:serine/threonine-protein kinase